MNTPTFWIFQSTGLRAENVAEQTAFAHENSYNIPVDWILIKTSPLPGFGIGRSPTFQDPFLAVRRSACCWFIKEFRRWVRMGHVIWWVVD
jgi:hypothetical protein